MMQQNREVSVESMRYRKKTSVLRSISSFILAIILVFSGASGAFSVHSTENAAGLFCNVRFSKPAICCDVGETISLADCGVQFSADSVMTSGGISWTHNGAAVKTFTPSARGVYALTAKSGSNTKTV